MKWFASPRLWSTWTRQKRSRSATGLPLASPPPGRGRGHSAALGARVPLYGSVHKTVDSGQSVRVVESLVGCPLAQYRRRTFRNRPTRAPERRPLTRLGRLPPYPRCRCPSQVPSTRFLATSILEVVTMEIADQARAFGDTLPAGLAA